MKPSVPRSFSIWLVAVIVGSLSLWVVNVEAETYVRGIIAKSKVGAGHERERQIPRSDVRCSPPEIPAYDGAELTCTPIQLPTASSYIIFPVGHIEGDIWSLEYTYTIEGGQLDTRTGEGEILLNQSQKAIITFVHRDPEFLALTIKFGIFGGAPSEYSGILDATSPGSNIYEGDLNDVFGNTLTFDLPGLQIAQ